MSVFSIVNNTGQVSNSTTSNSAILGPVATNVEVVFTGSMSNYSNNNLGVDISTHIFNCSSFLNPFIM